MTRATRTALLAGCLVLGVLFAPGRGSGAAFAGNERGRVVATALASDAEPAGAASFDSAPTGRALGAGRRSPGGQDAGSESSAAALVTSLILGPGLALPGAGR